MCDILSWFEVIVIVSAIAFVGCIALAACGVIKMINNITRKK